MVAAGWTWGTATMNPQTGKTIFTLANKITIVRICAVPVFILLLLYYAKSVSHNDSNEIYRFGALLVFSAAALSDALDGYFARARNEVTRLGRILDPIADKSLLLSAIILLTRLKYPVMAPHFPIWFTLLVISRDVILILGAFIVDAMAGRVEVQPRIVGKIATALQMACVIWVLTGYSSFWFYKVVIAASIFTFLSGVLYLIDGLRQIEHSPHAHIPHHN
jgi:CDP-diacylglycerol--glycerol-3-phosphate 3-phosphatidyltransferase